MPLLGAPSLPDRYTQANVATFTFESQEAGWVLSVNTKNLTSLANLV